MSNIDLIKRLFKDYTIHFIPKIILSVFFTVLVAGSTSSIAWLLDPAIKKIFIEKDQSLIVLIPIGIICAFTIKGTSLYFAKTIMIGVAEEVKKLIQIDMVKSFIKADSGYIEKKHSGKYISNLNYDVNLINMLLSTSLLNFFKDSLTLLGLLSVMFYQNWKLSLIALIMIPLASVSASTLGKRIKKVGIQAQEKSGWLNKYLVELFKNHKLIKIFQREEFEKNRADKLIDELKEKSKKMSVVFIRATPIMETLTGIMIAFLIFYSGKLILNNEIDINSFFSFLAAMMLAYQPVKSLATLNIGLNQGLSAATRILPIIDNKNKILEKHNAKNIQLQNGKIEFKNVSFTYEGTDRTTLDNINISFEGKKMAALVGLSGAGKSTILNLVPRLYDIDKGDILIDDTSIYDVKINSLRRNISIVSQDTSLFDDTIKNNLIYANNEVNDEEIIEAARLSNSLDFINNLPQKFDTVIGENGFRLSGGEKQRLSIARAILKKSKIILLDEATSSLDSETEAKIQKAIEFLIKDKTTIVIAHRLSTVLNANKIYVINDGKITESGNHKELINDSKIYKSFYEKQIIKN